MSKGYVVAYRTLFRAWQEDISAEYFPCSETQLRFINIHHFVVVRKFSAWTRSSWIPKLIEPPRAQTLFGSMLATSLTADSATTEFTLNGKLEYLVHYWRGKEATTQNPATCVCKRAYFPVLRKTQQS